MSQAKKNEQDNLKVFVSNLVIEKGLTNLEPEILSQLESDLYDRVEDRINVTIVAHVPVEKLDFFEQLVERSDTAEIQEFCARNIPGLDEIIAKELLEFRKTYLNLQ
jgi:hypothetical protein